METAIKNLRKLSKPIDLKNKGYRAQHKEVLNNLVRYLLALIDLDSNIEPLFSMTSVPARPKTQHPWVTLDSQRPVRIDHRTNTRDSWPGQFVVALRIQSDSSPAGGWMLSMNWGLEAGKRLAPAASADAS